ncbi:MAG: aminofutalosine synthase MqnE [Planctomycetota bacterium]|jgi:aminodeoxyfutalosine synthase
MMVSVVDSFADIREKIESGEPLSFGDGMRLYETRDIFSLGALANLVRERIHGDTTYYNINRHINYSNYCVLRCKFCSFYRPFARPGEDAPAGGYELSVEEVVSRAVEAYEQGATEVHIVGGLHPGLLFQYYLDMCSGIRDACPEIHIKAFTAIEIIHFSRIAKPRISVEEVLVQLRDAGLGSLPGGGAEIFDDRVHDEAFKTKVGETEWFEVHRIAHELGIFSNATMLYGHVETPAERVHHMIKLREHQAKSLATGKAHFNAVIPLSFIPDDSELSHLPGPSGLDDLKTLAVARLICHNIPHIKSFWIMHSPKLSQVSLDWGVNDIDGTVVYYDITKREGAGTTHQEMTVDHLRRMIEEARRVPVERDTLYRPRERVV